VPRTGRHAFWIAFENQSYDQVIGNRQLAATNRSARHT
jgi:hypothetical protein